MSAARWGTAALLYGVVILYASTIIGPMGPHFVPIDWYDALQRLAGMRYMEHGSDQRSDWMGNVAMLVPMGFMLAAWLSPTGRHAVRGGIGAFTLGLTFILAVKYVQLFFPPRTVTLNYVLAQGLGLGIGIAVRGMLRRPLLAIGQGIDRIGNLRTALQIYASVTILFFLTPLDFALNAQDLASQLERLPGTFTYVSGEGRPPVVRLILTAATIALMVPIGALLTFRSDARVYIGRSAGAATWYGFCGMIVVYALTTLVLSGSASLPAVGFRTIGIAIGAWFIHWLTRQNPDAIRRSLSRLVPWIVPAYLVAVAAVNGLISLTWIGPDTAAADFYRLGLYPLFNYYIVTKPQAAKNIAGHAAMYAPIGVMVWLRIRHGGGGKAFVLAALLSAAVEIGRFFRPGLVPDINALPLAGVSSWAAAASMPFLWRMLATVAQGGASPAQPAVHDAVRDAANWRDRAALARERPREMIAPIGDVEEYVTAAPTRYEPPRINKGFERR